MTPRDDVLGFLEAVPHHVLTIVDEAYFEYVEDPDFLDAIEEAAKQGGTSSRCGRSRRSTGLQASASATGSGLPS